MLSALMDLPYRYVAFFSFIIFACFLCITSAADTTSWKTRSIYFAMTDRIARGENDNGGSACDNLRGYCGGTFRGLEKKLDYIRGMGFGAIWITPVVTNADGGYHGYWAQDLYQINSHLGSDNDLKSLVNSAHAKGMYVMIDVAANHMGGEIDTIRPAPMNEQRSYHPDCEIDYSNDTSIRVCRLAYNLPDVKTEDPKIREFYYKWVNWLIDTFNFDGVRLDAVRHVEKDFWPGFTAAAAVYSIGEFSHGDPSVIAEYAATMSGFLNYPIYYPMSRFYLQRGSSQDMVDMHNRVGNSFPDPSAMGTFIDNHDTPRWLNQSSDQSLLENALAYTILSRGVPIIYYGTEQGFHGGKDPDNREDLWRSNYDTNSSLYKFIAGLNSAKHQVGGLGDNDHKHIYVDGNAYAWSRANGNLVVLTVNAGSGYTAQHCFYSQKPNGRWKEKFTGKIYQSESNGWLCANVVDGKPVILLGEA